MSDGSGIMGFAFGVSMASMVFLGVTDVNKSTYEKELVRLETVAAEAKEEEDSLFRFLFAVRLVESGNDPSAVGDDGNAIGAYQIWPAYWQDAVDFDASIGGEYEDCYDTDYATLIVRTYMERYANERRLGRPVTFEDMARIHNGGPNGFRATGEKRDRLDAYWSKVKNVLNDLENQG